VEHKIAALTANRNGGRYQEVFTNVRGCTAATRVLTEYGIQLDVATVADPG
jgi:hypothetical protein